MIFEGHWSEWEAPRPGRRQAKVTTHRVRFASQQEEVLFLRNMVRTYRHTHQMREWASCRVRESGCPPKRRICQAIAIARSVQRFVYYVNEGDETFQTPPRTLRYRIGDCDDFLTLISSAVEALGIQTELVAMWIADPPTAFLRFMESIGFPWELTRGGSFRHIFPRAVIPWGRRILRVPLDATLRAPAGTVNPIRIALARGDKVRLLVL